MNDLQQATPRATLSDDQNNKLQADVATLEDAQQARRQGQSVDQGKVQSAFNDIHDIVDSGRSNKQIRSSWTKTSLQFNHLSPVGPLLSPTDR
jgi:hypothetical protein